VTVAADKAAAAVLFARAGLEALPAWVFRGRSHPSAQHLARVVGSGVLMVRTASADEDRNLPRLAGADADAAAAWIGDLSPELDVIVQPYAEVVFSVEMACYGDGVVLAEVIPGIWELDARAEPVTVTLGLPEEQGGVEVAWPGQAQPAKFHSLETGYQWWSVAAQDWQIAEVAAWIRAHRAGLRAVMHIYGVPVGIKLHHAAGYGLSPQNIRTSVPVVPGHRKGDGAGAGDGRGFVVVDNVTQVLAGNVPDGHLVLDVRLAREDHQVLDLVIARLQEAGVDVVWLRSGLLSHLAITLREAGMEVRRAE
jgi:hypothetical protein